MSTLPTGTVTFLFTDIEGSTRLQYELGVDRYAEMRGEHHRLLRETCGRHSGVEVDAAGDGLFVAFATASGAAAAAVDAQLALKDLVGVRMGLHSGEPLLTPDGYAGIEVARAARISAVAHGGQIVLSQTTAELIGDQVAGFALRDLGEHLLKDLNRPQRLFQLVAEGLRDDFPPLRSIRNRRTNLPAHRPELIGREDELRQLAELLRDSDRRLVTLTGPGGSGKTVLAIEAAARIAEDFEDGVFLVRLETVDDPSLVLSAVADVLPVQRVEGVPPERLAADYLRSRSALVVLDNFEYVLDAAPAVSELAAGSERGRFLVTSIAPLRVSAEVEFPVHTLSLPNPVDDLDDVAGSSAVALFTERARLARPTFTLTAENASAVARVCIALDGLPLALELAAARTRVLSPSALVERVEHPLALLEGGARDLPDRHRALRATIDWSHALLDEAHQRLFARLSVFSGGATLEAIDAVCRPGDDLALDLVDGLAHLVECSLLETDERGDELRFTLLETIRAYARERLEASGNAGELHRRHAEYYLGDPALSEEYLVGYDARLVAESLELELANVRAALDWAHAERSPYELALAILYQRSPQVFSAEARRVLERALAQDGRQNLRLRGRALAAAGGISRQLGDPDAARMFFEESVELYRELEDTTGALAHVLLRLSHAAMDRDDLDEALRIALESEALARVSDDRDLNRAYIVGTLGELNLARGELEQARAHFAEAKELLPDQFLGDEGLALLALLEGRPADAVAQLAGCLRKVDLTDPVQTHTWALVEDMAPALLEAGEPSTSVLLYTAARTWQTTRGTSVGFGFPPRLRTRLFAAVEELAASPECVAETREGRELDLEGAVELGLEAAGRVAERP